MGTCTIKINKEARTVIESAVVKKKFEKTPATPDENINFKFIKSETGKGLSCTRNDFEVEGLFPSISEDPFAEKPLTFNGRNSNKNFVLSNIGITCRKGLKDGLNQDNFFLASRKNLLIAGIFDGHGENGHKIASLARKFVNRFIWEDNDLSQNPIISLQNVFRKTQEEITKKCLKTNVDCSYSGCSATVIIYQNSSFYIANIGNCRAYISKRLQEKLITIPLTNDHNLADPSEKARIQSHSNISCFSLLSTGSDKEKSENIDRQFNLNVTRAFGDTKFMDFGVISEPFISEFKLLGDEYSIVLCSQGAWELVKTSEISKILEENNLENFTNILANLAWSRWIDEYNDLVEDITAIVIPI
ncbi:hypothetical protein SteCoe_7537 [Stentor coeruleus]|uniref:PPM-type phosphatase domain-containing protein n=1 Tax=Stentor coeruleus TaxID=5963 RepID=A0A1R2CMF7_9CILI|nr:hypothetical protein SteCoe_7537 [Stentor coeruleus]